MREQDHGLIFDCHLDLAMNAVHWNRDLTRSLTEIREREAGLTDKKDRGNSVVSFAEMRKAKTRFCIATQIGHTVSQQGPLPGWSSPEIAWAQTQAQLAWYLQMENLGELKQIRSRQELVASKNALSKNQAIGFILSLEGADSLVNLDYLHRAYEYGLRLIGPAHYGPGRYAAGTGETNGFTKLGFELLREMSSLKMILDVTHLTDRGFDEALENYDGPVIASHHNCRVFVDHQRQLSDDQIRRLVERNSIIGVALDAWMLVPGWVRGKSTPVDSGVSLEHVANNIDHVCQIAGSADHCVLGTDLDGAFGCEQTPIEIRSAGKLGELGSVLAQRKYDPATVDKFLFGNAFSFFENNLTSETFDQGGEHS